MLKIPKALSGGEELFAMHCTVYGLTPQREYQFDPARKWRADFAFPEQRILVEIEGGTAFGKSRHSQGKGFEDDARKYNRATQLGWRVLRFSTKQVETAEAIDFVREMLS